MMDRMVIPPKIPENQGLSKYKAKAVIPMKMVSDRKAKRIPLILIFASFCSDSFIKASFSFSMKCLCSCSFLDVSIKNSTMLGFICWY